MEYSKRKKTLEALNITYPTLYAMADRGEIDTIMVGKNTLYNLNKYLRQREITNTKKEKICYCRVSSNKQKEDLKRQITFMKDKYPGYKIISDIVSGINYKRNGFKEIIDKAINGRK